MIDVKLQDDKVFIKFKGENFPEVLKKVQEYHLKFIEEEKSFTGTYQQLYNVIPELKKIEEFSVLEEIEELIKPKIKLISKRRQFKPELLKKPPLAEYQVDGIKKMLCHNGIINGDECGLGKTFQTISVINHLLESKEIDKIFICTVSETVYNWKHELLEFSFMRPDDILISNKDLRNPFDFLDKKVIICSYTTFILIEKYYHSKHNKRKLTKRTRKNSIPFSSWGKSICCILDESQRIKGRDTLTGKTILRYADEFTFKYLLSATPWPNGIYESYNSLNFLDSNIIYSEYEHFEDSLLEKEYNGFIKTDENGNKVYKQKFLAEFCERIQPYVFKRRKKDVLPNLPGQNIKRIFVELNSKQAEIYQAVISNSLMSIKKEKGEILVKDVVYKFPYLLLNCSDPFIIKDSLINGIEKDKLFDFDDSKLDLEKLLKSWNFKDNSKLEACGDIISEYIQENKVIIWSYHPMTIELLQEYYKQYQPFVIHGKSHIQAKEDKESFRNRILEEFKKSQDRNLAIFNPDVMGTGNNIKEAPVAIFFDGTFNVESYIQTLGRNHRANSTEEVFIYRLILDNTLDVRMNAMLDGKENLNDDLLKYDYLNKDDWQKIFTGNLDK